jgi:uncharacterized protein YdaU (DUF1376 family)
VLKKSTCYCCSKKGHYSHKRLEKDKRSKDEWAVKKAMMHAQAESEKETKEKDDDDNASQALRRSNKNDKQREWNNLIVKKTSLHNNTTVNSGHLTPKKTASYWITDQR